ncbi:MAG: carbohydrate ABC transporter permease [Lachnospiraceae bacterium]|nr:carbohydrate ABC transporter permease [Lachnospiraceae bacterium]
MAGIKEKYLQLKTKVETVVNEPQFDNEKSRAVTIAKKLIFGIFKIVILVGICYVVLSPVIGMVSHSFFSDADVYNPMVYIIPQNPTMDKMSMSYKTLDYLPHVSTALVFDLSLLLIQLIICSMVGYGFARFKFPGKNFLFACVVIMIVLPLNSIMLPLYMTFRNFPIPFPVISATGVKFTKNLLTTPWPMYIMTIFGCGLRSGLFIYIFNQFFRGLPKEIEEAAFVDGASMWYTYSRIMLVNSMPAVITVAVFSMVWQYNDMFYTKLFILSDKISMGKNIGGLTSTIANAEQITNPAILQLYLDAGIVLVILPVIILYVILQSRFIEGVERSGIVG